MQYLVVKSAKIILVFSKAFFVCVFCRNVQEMNFCLAQEQGSIVTVLREGWKVTSKGNI